MTNNTLLHPGDRFPALMVAPRGGGGGRLPDELAGQFGVILFCRGSRWPYCNAQLRAFQRSLDRLTRIGELLVTLSVDDEVTTQELIATHGLQFSIGHRANARAVAAATGVFVNHDPVYLQSTGFALCPARSSSA